MFKEDSSKTVNKLMVPVLDFSYLNDSNNKSKNVVESEAAKKDKTYVFIIFLSFFCIYTILLQLFTFRASMNKSKYRVLREFF
jgi:hypothetical protein